MAGDRSKGYYSFDLGAWHVIAINSNCAEVGCSSGSAQEAWLRADLASHPVACTLAFWHHPRFSSGLASNNVNMSTIYQDLYNANADLVLTAHDHLYERFAPQTPAGLPDPSRGHPRVHRGHGRQEPGGLEHGQAQQPGAQQQDLRRPAPGPARQQLRLEVRPEAGQKFTDAGSTACH